MLKYTSLNQDLIYKIQNFNKMSTDFRSWEDLPILEQNRTDLYFIDAKKNSLLIFDDSIHYTQIDLTTGATKVLPCYQK